MGKKRETQVSSMKDFEVPLPRPIIERLHNLADGDGQTAAALARSFILDGIRDLERHEMDVAKYSNESAVEEKRPRGNTPQKGG